MPALKKKPVNEGVMIIEVKGDEAEEEAARERKRKRAEAESEENEEDEEGSILCFMLLTYF